MTWVVNLCNLIFSKKALICLGLLSMSYLSQSQQIAESQLPVNNLIYYSNILTYINPSGQVLDKKFMLNLKYSSHTGVRKEINELYADGWLHVDSERKLALGFQLLNNNQGPFIHLLNAKALIRYKIPLNENISVNPGIGFGALNYVFEGNATTAGGSDIAPDLDMGVSLQSKTVNIGIAAQHLINRNLRPLDAPSKKNQLITTYVANDNKISPSFDIKTTLAGIYRYNTNEIDFDITTETVYKEHYKIILLLYHLNTLGYGVAFENIQTFAGQLGFNFIYSNPVFRNNIINSNRYEIGICYRLR